MRYFLKSKTSINQEAEPYDDKEHLMARLWGTYFPDYIIIIGDRGLEKPNIICDLKAHGEWLWLSAFYDTTMQTLYDDVVPMYEKTDSLDSLFNLLMEIEQK